MSKLSIGITGNDRLLAGDIEQRQGFARQIEQSSVDHIFIADHVSFHTGMGMDAMVNAATLTTMMPTMTVMLGVYLLALRHPVPVARQLSSLSISAPGRIVLGVGIGGEDRHEMEICGVDPSRRGVHTNHSLQALRGLMTGEATSHDCDFFNFTDAVIKPAPEPEIPIVIGGRSEAAIKRTANYGDGWLSVWVSPDRFGSAVQQITDLAGDREVDWTHGLQLWCGIGENARESVAKGMEGFYRVPFEKFERYTPYGTPAEIAEFLSGYVERGARILNIEPRGGSIEEAIEAVSEVSDILHQAYPDL